MQDPLGDTINFVIPYFVTGSSLYLLADAPVAIYPRAQSDKSGDRPLAP